MRPSKLMVFCEANGIVTPAKAGVQNVVPTKVAGHLKDRILIFTENSGFRLSQE